MNNKTIIMLAAATTFIPLCKLSAQRIINFETYGMCSCIKKCYLGNGDLQKYLISNTKGDDNNNDSSRTDHRVGGVRSGAQVERANEQVR